MTTDQPPTTARQPRTLTCRAARRATRPRALRVAFAVAARLDSTPASPAWWGELAAAPFAALRRARVDAALGPDPLSDANPHRDPLVGLDWLDEAIERCRTGTALLPYSRLERAAHRTQQIGYRAALTQAWRAWQLLDQGWSEDDLWSLDRAVCLRLGEQLDALTHAEAGGDITVTDDDWLREAHTAAQALLTYAAPELPPRDDGYPDQRRERAAQATEALRWVADNLGRLWL